MLAYGAGASTMYHLHRNDRYQNVALAISIGSGIILGMIGLQSLEAIMLHILPWTVLLALLLSAVGHRMVLSGQPKVVEDVIV